ncbi:hypothetical protein M2451_002796 [Dysgonomonas sp. PFB1-18]|uniref:hypothetical protein n=1 Tax=unclassified Dysgonomonas TaxID=2630389 RepID=UPI0024738D10|nr:MULTISPECIES: hypothetical protein [unclassified Dysgonomonas]MDH6309318.1 hypothetical protein [Dysgonomonas sp. PF1-14]MDH6339817.1 hypothetical protein [Dysgonomonas sp. PF1-16]MDH6381465.1 hypothetical protein [Dysgonomonas sp. PFB1-18]MDH6398680.1 hypothetical protein [Dysgonomonas sp. PF1-23]
MKLAKNKLNRDFIAILYQHYPQLKDLANFLIDVLDMGKESVYRRLRNEVAFSFDEIAAIALALNVSLDKFIGSNTNRVYLEMQMHEIKEHEELYVEIISSNIRSIQKMSDQNALGVYSALNRLPFGYTLAGKKYAKFYYYKWLYHTLKGAMKTNFSDFILPASIQNIQEEFIKVSNSTKCEMSIIFDENIFLYSIREFNYFRKRGLINDEDTQQIQAELNRIVEAMEYSTRTGENGLGANIRIYLSLVDVEPNVSYVSYPEPELCTFNIWSPAGDIVTTTNPEFCRRQKEWLDSMARYTTLITQCNEKEQIEFFNKQREYIANMTNNL